MKVYLCISITSNFWMRLHLLSNSVPTYPLKIILVFFNCLCYKAHWRYIFHLTRIYQELSISCLFEIPPMSFHTLYPFAFDHKTKTKICSSHVQLEYCSYCLNLSPIRGTYPSLYYPTTYVFFVLFEWYFIFIPNVIIINLTFKFN